MRQVLTATRAESLARIALRRLAQATSASDPAAPGGSDCPCDAPDLWVLARLLVGVPAMASAADVQALFDRRFAATAFAAEPTHRNGLPSMPHAIPGEGAWTLKLAAELRHLDDARGTGWGVALAPLAETMADRFMAVLPGTVAPIRAGTEANSALALVLARDYALATQDDALLGLFWQKAVDWFGRGRGGGTADPDRGGGAAEPDRGVIVSPALIEAECMRGLLPPGQWRPWFDVVLPGIADRRPAALFGPADVGFARRAALDLGRAWCWRGLARGLSDDDPRRPIMEEAAEIQLAAALDSGGETGEEWPASLALLALEA